MDIQLIEEPSIDPLFTQAQEVEESPSMVGSLGQHMVTPFIPDPENKIPLPQAYYTSRPLPSPAEVFHHHKQHNDSIGHKGVTTQKSYDPILPSIPDTPVITCDEESSIERPSPPPSMVRTLVDHITALPILSALFSSRIEKTPSEPSPPLSKHKGKTSSEKHLGNKRLSEEHHEKTMDGNPDRDDSQKEITQLLLDTKQNRTHQIEVLFLFFEVLKLFIHSDRRFKEQRQEERLAQLEAISTVVKSWITEKESQYNLYWSGILGCVSSVIPILGNMPFGTSLFHSITKIGFLSSLSSMSMDAFYEGGSKLARSFGDMLQATPQVTHSQEESARAEYQTQAQIHQSDHDEYSRRLQETTEELNQILRFLQQMMEMEYNVASKLYY